MRKEPHVFRWFPNTFAFSAFCEDSLAVCQEMLRAVRAVSGRPHANDFQDDRLEALFGMQFDSRGAKISN
jgi:hypothetical protein